MTKRRPRIHNKHKHTKIQTDRSIEGVLMKFIYRTNRSAAMAVNRPKWRKQMQTVQI